jgi:multidrug resistance efflux pump
MFLVFKRKSNRVYPLSKKPILALILTYLSSFFMKFNLLFLLIPAAAYGCYWILTDLQGQSGQAFFATAESESRMLTFEHDVLVSTVHAEVGQQVKAGDTLATLFRAELDKTTTDRLADINQIEAERTAKSSVLEKEKDVLLAKKAAALSEIQAKIKVLQAENTVQVNLKNEIYSDPSLKKPQNALNLKQAEIAALEATLPQIEQEYTEQIRQLESQRQANQTIATAKVQQIQKDLDFVRLERSKLVLIAPMDGFVEQLNIAKNSLVPSYKDLIKINPRRPNKLIGFIHEAANVPFQLGDSVTLASATRKTVKTAGRIIGSSPRLVELPYRLRKFTEVRAWGREVYIQIPDTNRFLIGEKIMVNLTQ